MINYLLGKIPPNWCPTSVVFGGTAQVEDDNGRVTRFASYIPVHGFPHQDPSILLDAPGNPQWNRIILEKIPGYVPTIVRVAGGEAPYQPRADTLMPYLLKKPITEKCQTATGEMIPVIKGFRGPPTTVRVLSVDEANNRYPTAGRVPDLFYLVLSLSDLIDTLRNVLSGGNVVQILSNIFKGLKGPAAFVSFWLGLIGLLATYDTFPQWKPVLCAFLAGFPLMAQVGRLIQYVKGGVPVSFILPAQQGFNVANMIDVLYAYRQEGETPLQTFQRLRDSSEMTGFLLDANPDPKTKRVCIEMTCGVGDKLGGVILRQNILTTVVSAAALWPILVGSFPFPGWRGFLPDLYSTWRAQETGYVPQAVVERYRGAVTGIPPEALQHVLNGNPVDTNRDGIPDLVVRRIGPDREERVDLQKFEIGRQRARGLLSWRSGSEPVALNDFVIEAFHEMDLTGDINKVTDGINIYGVSLYGRGVLYELALNLGIIDKSGNLASDCSTHAGIQRRISESRLFFPVDLENNPASVTILSKLIWLTFAPAEQKQQSSNDRLTENELQKVINIRKGPGRGEEFPGGFEGGAIGTLIAAIDASLAERKGGGREGEKTKKPGIAKGVARGRFPRPPKNIKPRGDTLRSGRKPVSIPRKIPPQK